ncbi:MAG: SDR family NAD(P)-dependent oxidoreductase, partial [Planctomycetota bacterium]
MDPRGKVAVVTGGARRLGREFALALAEAGADVAVHYGRSEREAEDVLAAIRKKGVRAAAVQADLADPEAARAVVARAAEQLGTPRILVNSAAVFEKGTLRETGPANWDRHLDVNL